MTNTTDENLVGRRSLLEKTATLLGTAMLVGADPTGRAVAQETAGQTLPAAVPVLSGVTYRHIGRWEAPRLNRILTVDAPAFLGFKVDYKPARNAVDRNCSRGWREDGGCGAGQDVSQGVDGDTSAHPAERG